MSEIRFAAPPAKRPRPGRTNSEQRLQEDPATATLAGGLPDHATSLPVEHQQRRSLWLAVRSAIALGRPASGARSESEGPDEQSTSGSVNTSAGRHISDQWRNIGHLDLDREGSEATSKAQRTQRVRESSNRPMSPEGSSVTEPAEAQTSRRPTSPIDGRKSRAPQRGPTQAKWRRFFSPTRSIERHSALDPNSSVMEEPSSFIDDDPNHVPEGEDPLEYTPQKKLLDSDTDTDTEDDHTEADVRQNVTGNKTVRSRWDHTIAFVKGYTMSDLTKGILKCAIAYLLASFFTFSPFLSSHVAMLLPSHDAESEQKPISNMHMVATVAVYFHPAKSLGAMLQADLFAFVAFLYSIGLGISSMAVASFLHDADQPVLSNIVSVVIFIGLGMGFVGYAKIKIGKPSFNTACSMLSVIVFTVVVKEGSTHLGHFRTEKTFQVTLVVLIGTIISNVICFFIWPQSACSNLQRDVRRNLQGFSTLLKVLTKTFLLDDPDNFSYKSDRIRRAIEDHHASFTSLKKNLQEAKLEAPFDARMRGNTSKYVAVVDSMNKLAQHLGGLRSSCSLQHEILMAQRRNREAGDVSIRSQTKAEQYAAHMAENAAAKEESRAARPSSSQSAASEGGTIHVQEQASAFEAFVDDVGPHMRSVVFTCCRTFNNLRHAFAPTAAEAALRSKDVKTGATGSRFAPGGSFQVLREDLEAALRRFRHEQAVAIKHIYTLYPGDGARIDKQRQKFALGGLRETMTSSAGSRPDEDIFLVFFFVFNLEEFAKELELLVGVMEEIRASEELIAQRKSMGWLTWIGGNVKDLFRRNTKHSHRGPQDSIFKIIAQSFQGDKSAAKNVDWPSTRRNTLDTEQTPRARKLSHRIGHSIWRLGEFIRQPDTKFSIKAGVGCALLAAPAFIHSTRPTFVAYKGQWALVSFMVVLSGTVGQSNQMSIHRVAGTFLGAITAILAYRLLQENPVALPLFGFIFSLPCFRYIVGVPQYASSGRFVLLTYNLTCLYSFNLRKTGLEIGEVAFHRTISVLVGVLWATVLNHLVWPFEARRELAVGISEFLFRASWLYQRIVFHYAHHPEALERSGSKKLLSPSVDESQLETQPLLNKAADQLADEFQGMELHLQIQLIELENLLSQTQHEPRLKGPFPYATYKQILGTLQNVLDKLHSMRSITGRDGWAPLVQTILQPVAKEHRDVVGQLILLMYTLGAAFRLKSPLPPYLPPAEHYRVQLLDAIRELPAIKRRAVRGSTEYLLFYSYSLSLRNVIEQLELLGRLTQNSFGVLGGSREAFERQFEQPSAP